MRHDLIDATDLSQWAERKDAESLLPELVRKLVSSSVTPNDLIEVSFSSREGINAGGWDGWTASTATHTYVPIGVSGWEMGKGVGEKAKAESDYSKRTAEVPLDKRKMTSFIFVTPRKWANKKRWVEEKKAEGAWKDVIVLDAHDLVAWLEQQVGVHYWITDVVKGPSGEVTSGEAYWQKWAQATKPPLSPPIVLSGRKQEAEALAIEISGKPFSKAIHSQSKEESIAFALSTIKSLPENSRESLLSRTLIVDSEFNFNQLIENKRPLILITRVNTPNTALAIEKGHSVIIPSGAAKLIPHNSLALPRMNLDEAVAALRETGIEHNRAYELAKIARRSLLAFRREIAVHPETLTPEWMTGPGSTELIPALLVGGWVESNEQDKKILEELAGVTYGQYERTLIGFETREDPPLTKSKSTWRTISDKDACEAIMRYISSEQKESFQRLALKVLGTEDPAFDLAPDERWMANIKGYAQPYSAEIKKGIAASLAMLAANQGDDTPAHGQVTYQQIADHVVAKLLEAANKDGSGKVWYSLREQLSLFAEAAPDIFLDGVEAGLKGDNPVLATMFVEDKNHFTSSPHNDLLFALERLSWNEVYIARAALCLAKLAELDPGGNSANRPLSSLLDILSIIRPQTTADAQGRLKLIDLIDNHYPGVGHRLLVALIPENQAVHFGNSEPEYRKWKPDLLPSVTYGELYKMINEIVNRLLKSMSGQKGEKWKDLLAKLTNLPADDFDLVVTALGDLKGTDLDDAHQASIWNEIRLIISNHRQFPEAKWAYPPEQIDKLEEIYNALTPTSSTTLYAWLFAQHVELINPSGHDWQENEKRANEFRIEAATKIYDTESIAGILKLLESVDNPYLLGYSLTVSPKDEDMLLEQINSEDVRTQDFLRGYIAHTVQVNGVAWANEKLLKYKGVWRPEDKAALLLAAPANKALWLDVEKLGNEVERAYWKKILPYGLGTDFRDYVLAAKKFLAFNQPYHAITALNYAEKDESLNPQLIIDTLQKASRSNPLDSRTDIQMLGFNVSRLIRKLSGMQSVDTETVAQLEMTWFPVLRHEHEGGTMELHKKLAKEPEFFLELISLVYRAKSAPKKAPSKSAQQKAGLADDMLRSWRKLPGQKDDSTIDYDELKAWVTKSMRLLAETDRSSPGEYHIGRILFCSLQSASGAWPQDEVCRLIDELASDRVDEGFVTEAFNSGGFTWEKDYSSLQRADKIEKRASEIAFTYPRAAKTLRRAAANLHSSHQRLFGGDD
jgi:hypothetical protein